MELKELLESKTDYGARKGFRPLFIPDYLFDFQKYLVDFALRLGRAAIFADCGTGKTITALVWAQNIIMKTNKPVLNLAPLIVNHQTQEEAERFGLEAIQVKKTNTKKTIQITNYEKLHHFDPSVYGGIIGDESSILKNFKGMRKTQIIEFMRRIPYRSLWTATPAPNDWEELGNSSEALGYYGYTDMLSKFFTNKNHSIDNARSRFRQDKFSLRPHAAQGPFWQWVSSWARALQMPSDLGFDDNGFILPPLIENNILVKASTVKPGMLFDLAAVRFDEQREVTRRTIPDRCEKVAELVENHDISMIWCHLNDEAALLKKLIPNSIEISGRDKDAKKEEAVHWFKYSTDTQRRIITKPPIFGYGLNLQHCHHMTYFPTDSYERYYQARSRLLRFGQTHNVTVDRVYTDGGERMLENLDRKTKNAKTMFKMLTHYMNEALILKDNYTTREITRPQWM